MSMNARRFYRWGMSIVLALFVIVWPCAARSLEIDIPSAEYTAEGTRNPFKSYIVKPSQPEPEVEAQPVVMKAFPSFSIQGVFWGGRFPQAIINDKIVKEGDLIDEAKVLRITRDHIKFLFANREFSVSPSSLETTNLSESRKEAP